MCVLLLQDLLYTKAKNRLAAGETHTPLRKKRQARELTPPKQFQPTGLRKKGVYKVPTFSDEKSSDSSSDDDKAGPRLQSKRAQSTDTMEMEEVDDEGIRYSDAPVRRRGGGIAGRAASARVSPRNRPRTRM